MKDYAHESRPAGPGKTAGLVSDPLSAIDFHSPEFNRTDELHDSHPVCDFEPLDGIITADMRHRLNCLASPDEGGGLLQTTAPRPPAQAAEDSQDGPAFVTMISEGRVLIIDTDSARAKLCRKTLTRQLFTVKTLIIRTPETPSGASSPLSGRPAGEINAVFVNGAFCGFTADVLSGEDRRPLTVPPEYHRAVFDLVLDLQPVPSFAGSRLPAGYFAPGPDAEALQETLGEMSSLRGQFRKPQFVAFRSADCLHGRSRHSDCRSCLDICPFGAIESSGRQITFNHALCQGCGACALACSTDAIRMHRPEANSWQSSLGGLLASDTGQAPHVYISEADSACRPAGEDDVCATADGEIHVEVGQITDVRLDLLLASLDGGARDVCVICDAHQSPGVQSALSDQIGMMHAVLRGLGLPENYIRFGASRSEPPLSSGTKVMLAPPLPLPAAFPSGESRRSWIRQAVENLCVRQGRRVPELPLPPGAPFGAVAVNAAACTLCMACVSACPFGALSAGASVPRLAFCEASCRQCGLCREVCPEQAIRLIPRFLGSADQAEATRILHECEPFRCLECGLPFAPAAMISRTRDKLQGHWMYANDRQIRRLSLCRTCRTRDALLFEEGSPWKIK